METLKGFVVFEGLDGSGTTTQGKMLQESLSASGRPALFTGEPTDNPIGRLLRQALGASIALTRSSIAHLFAADRNQHLYEPVSGMLAAAVGGTIVICDRYVLSSLAYQTIDCSEELVQRLNAGFPLPELLVYLDVPVEVCMQRIHGRDKREIFEYGEFQRQVKTRYEQAVGACRARGQAVLWIDGDRPVEIIHAEIKHEVEQRLAAAGR